MYDKTISYRQINLDFDVSVIAKLYDGKGHKEAASSPLKLKLINSIIYKTFGMKMFFKLFDIKK